MLLAIDVGNTNIVFAVFQGDTLRKSWRCRTDNASSTDEYAAFLSPLLALENIGWSDFSDVLISSVVPETDRHMREFCQDYIGCDPLFVSKDLVDVKVDRALDRDVGADRLVNAYAVQCYYQSPAIVIDFGTATTFDVLESGGVYAGGVIAPGINLSVSALAQAASKLPKVNVEKPASVLGKSTVAAMQSGVYWGYVGLIKEILRGLVAEMSAKPIIIATGGLAPLFEQDVDLIDVFDQDLNIKGLQKIYQMQESRKAA